MGSSASVNHLPIDQKHEIINALEEARFAYNKAIFTYYDNLSSRDNKYVFITVFNISDTELMLRTVIKFPKLPRGHIWNKFNTIDNNDLGELCNSIFYQLKAIKYKASYYNILASNMNQPKFELPIVKLPAWCGIDTTILD